MSVESLAIAMHHSKAKGTTKLVLLGIANHDGDGGAWPSVATLARYANCKARQVQYAIDTLIKLGEIRRDLQGGGDNRMQDHLRPNRYHFILRCPPNCDRTKQHRTRHHELVTFEDDPVHSSAPGAVDSTPPVHSSAPKPPMNQPSRDSSGNDEYVSHARGPQCWKGHPLLDDAEVCLLGHYSPEREAVRLAELETQR